MYIFLNSGYSMDRTISRYRMEVGLPNSVDPHFRTMEVINIMNFLVKFPLYVFIACITISSVQAISLLMTILYIILKFL